MEPPGFVKGLGQNKMASFMMIWLLGNVMASAFLQTGAFEIYYDNKTVWSSLANGGRMPTYWDIFNGFKAHGFELMESVSEGGHR